MVQPLEGRTDMNDERRQRFREQLVYEFQNPEQITKKPNKLSVSLCKRESPRSRFLKKKGNKPEPGDKITYMLVEKRAPKVKPDFIPVKSVFKQTRK
jgi:hypothetical protein